MCTTNSLRIPILMYHGISMHLDDHLHPYFQTVTSPESFEHQMNFLNENGYQVLTLSEAVYLTLKTSLPFKSNIEETTSPISLDKKRPMVVITFDDGLRDFYTTAFPILEKFGFKATVFLTSGLIDKIFPTGSECLREAEIKKLAGKGIEFGSHTVTHPQLKNLSMDEIAHQLANSKKHIEDILGHPMTLFSYPYRFPEEDANFTQMLGKLLLEQGYSMGVTTIIGRAKSNDNPLFLKRLPINDCDDTLLFQAKLEGGYDWLHAFQLTSKEIRALLRGQKTEVFNAQSNC